MKALDRPLPPNCHRTGQPSVVCQGVADCKNKGGFAIGRLHDPNTQANSEGDTSGLKCKPCGIGGFGKMSSSHRSWMPSPRDRRSSVKGTSISPHSCRRLYFCKIRLTWTESKALQTNLGSSTATSNLRRHDTVYRQISAFNLSLPA